MVEPVYEKVCGTVPLTASNLVESKTVLTSPGITVNIKPDAADKVRTSVMDGRRVLLIDIDDPTIQINGLPVTLKAAAENETSDNSQTKTPSFQS